MVGIWKKILVSVAGGVLTLAGAGAGYKIVKERNSLSLDRNLQIVTEVIDGDTVAVEADDERIKIRILGINAPEKGECFFDEAKDYATELMEGEYVRLVKDVEEEDDYGRLLRYLILQSGGGVEDNINVSEHMVRYGYAEIYPSVENKLYRNLLNMAQGEAKAERRGLWAECKDPNDTSALRETDSSPDNPECNIKGNISEKGYGMTYLVPGCDNYNRVKIDTKKGEQYFCTEKEALEAGFRKATNCP